MISHTTDRFRQAFTALPVSVRQQARKAYLLFSSNPSHPSLRFKQVHTTHPVFSVRVGLSYRALAVRKNDTLIWFWIGSHEEYELLLKKL
ncbi:MAG: hypothetical protein WCP97_03685 [bacterium]